MGVRAVVQPNGLFARFSSVVDDFTDINMTEQEALELFRDECGIQEAAGKIQRAKDSPGRYAESIRIIKSMHGEESAKEVELEMSEFQK